MAEQSLKKAPRREIVEVRRSGDWGEVEYAHVLACGHQEIRKRKSTKTHIGCLGCLRASEFEESLKKIQPRIEPLEVIAPLPEWTLVEESASSEAEVERLRAAIAAHLGISPDSVDVVTSQQTGKLEVSYVLAFIDAMAARGIAKKVHHS